MWKTQISMKFLMDKIVRELVEEAWDFARLGRDRDFMDRNEVFAETLAELESEGDAMRYVDRKEVESERYFERLFLLS